MTDLAIDHQKTALVVIDLQTGIVANNTAPYSSSEVITNASAIANKFRENTMPVFLVRVNTAKDGSDRLNPISDKKPFSNVQQSDWADIVPEMGPLPNDIVITKHQWGAFYGTELDLQLRRREI
ncbi:MAG TPA: isochorismatase family protein, partial [Candidatus Dormibacteraeota bacterium]|nr:isochorismatase family protein [Candidatus Dormibacteraeota bacterium]